MKCSALSGGRDPVFGTTCVNMLMWQGQEANQDQIFNPKNIARGILKNKIIDSETKHPAAHLRTPIIGWLILNRPKFVVPQVLNCAPYPFFEISRFSWTRQSYKCPSCRAIPPRWWSRTCFLRGNIAMVRWATQMSDIYINIYIYSNQNRHTNFLRIWDYKWAIWSGFTGK